MPDLNIIKFAAMTLAQLRSASNVLGITPYGGKTVLLGEINRELKKRNKPKAECLDEVFESSTKPARYFLIESHYSKGMVLTLSGNSVILKKKIGSTGGNEQLWRFTQETTGSLVCKAKASNGLIQDQYRLSIKDRANAYGEYELQYGTESSGDKYAKWVWRQATNTYEIHPSGSQLFDAWALPKNLSLDVNEGGDVCVTPYVMYSKNSQKWSFGGAAGPQAPQPLQRSYSELFPYDTPPSHAAMTQALPRMDSQDEVEIVKVRQANEKLIKRIFHRLDTDGDGFLTGRDWDDPRIATPTRRKRHDNWLEIRWYMDVDGDGRITFDEFRRGIIKQAIENSPPPNPQHNTTMGQYLQWLTAEVNKNIASLVASVQRKFAIPA